MLSGFQLLLAWFERLGTSFLQGGSLACLGLVVFVFYLFIEFSYDPGLGRGCACRRL